MQRALTRAATKGGRSRHFQWPIEWNGTEFRGERLSKVREESGSFTNVPVVGTLKVSEGGAPRWRIWYN